MILTDTVRTLTGHACAALPISACTVARPYLLDRAGIPNSGTAVFLAVPYCVCADARDAGRNLSLYAVPRDYHLYVKELAASLVPALEGAYPGHRFALFADHSPVIEVGAAARAGLGVVGMNGLLITPDYGSLVFILDLVTDLTPDEAGCPVPDPNAPLPTCEGCGACLRACPVLARASEADAADRSACLSALTQKKGTLTDEERAHIASHPLVWGCDTCQLVCPHNRAVLAAGRDTPVPFFRTDRLTRLDKDTLAAMTDERFAERAYAWRGRAVIERNLEIKGVLT